MPRIARDRVWLSLALKSCPLRMALRRSPGLVLSPRAYLKPIAFSPSYRFSVCSTSRTEVANVEPLKGLTALQSLALVGTNVMDLRPLES
jgi:hypothetical protein